ncbi:DUF3857 domain-containing transglutaminase family protein [Psychroflexus halocasei]|uniref:Transglutaminase-like superfamily protein n=1 Tax=Psychroflexus halocasei TaxID=908615 RepID=A0A1H3ZMS5_9FLAO|nr:DUF3857 domain-containing transglutaminase family protein [Psychroflexus halocasei]SEA24957.1 Transglutaminase-like superfamily protein [Psychroflexus halocasei]
MKLIYFQFFLIFFISSICAQDYSPLTIKDTLKIDANSVIRDKNVVITIDAIDKMSIDFTKIITVFNSEGLKQVGAYVYYDDVSKVKDLNLYVYDLIGEEKERFKKRDFIDQSAVSGGTLYSDSRVYHMDYKPKSYPVTLKFEYTLTTSNTAFIRPFYPVGRYYQSVENSSFKIINNTSIKLRSKNQNFENFNIKQKSDFHFIAENIPAVKKESYSPSLENFVPSVKFALNKFNLEGVQGEAHNWKEFGQWQYENFLKGYDELPANLISEIENLTQDADTNREKAELIYQFMQDNSRYISVQLGIGGWRPMPAEDVYDKKYGDCKALTNYTKAMLKSVGIESKYCVVYAGSEKRDIDPDFFSMQGNHVILKVLDDDEDYWLECTSQTQPFGFLGTFTDNRKVLAIDENGGEIIETPKYVNSQNLQKSIAQINFSQLDMHTEIKIESYGTQYNRKPALERLSPKYVREFYKEYWSNLNRLSINSYHFENDKKEIKFTQSINLIAQNFLQKLGNDIILTANPFNQNTPSIKTYNERTNPFQLMRGYKDVDQYEFLLGDYKVGYLPENVTIDSKFGKYELHFSLQDENKLIVNRNLEVYKNNYEKEEYEDFVNFLNEISRNDQSKLILN